MLRIECTNRVNQHEAQHDFAKSKFVMIVEAIKNCALKQELNYQLY